MQPIYRLRQNHWGLQGMSERIQQNSTFQGAMSVVTSARVDAAGQGKELPDKHAFLTERLLEFSATVPYAGLSPGCKAALAAKDSEVITCLEAIFSMLPPPRKVRAYNRSRRNASECVIVIICDADAQSFL